MNQTVAVFGATGAQGSPVAAQAIEAGFTLPAIVLQPTIYLENLQIPPFLPGCPAMVSWTARRCPLK